jgi:hypothetical protein
MKKTTRAALAVAALGISALVLTAQDANTPQGNGQPQRPHGPGHGPGRHGHRPPLPPIIAALDANHDGVIDESEIANAASVLKTLDRNGDGKLTYDELLPPPPADFGAGPEENDEPKPGGPNGPQGQGGQ